MQDMLSQATAMREQMEQRLAATIVEADTLAVAPSPPA